MLKRRRQRAADMHQKESHMKGKAYQELKNQQQQRQLTLSQSNSSSMLQPSNPLMTDDRQRDRSSRGGFNTFVACSASSGKSEVKY